MTSRRAPPLSLVMALGLLTVSNERAWGAECAAYTFPSVTCATLCDGDAVGAGHPITILYLGSATPNAWLAPSLTTVTADCSSCPLPQSGLVIDAVAWPNAVTWTPEQFRAYDVIVVDDAGAGLFSTLTNPTIPSLGPGRPWFPIFRSARRVVATTVHLDGGGHDVNMNAFRELAQNVVVWLAQDECCRVPSSQGVQPGVFLVNDGSTRPFSYTPWKGLAVSYMFGADSYFSCPPALYEYDDVVLTLSTHDLVRHTNAEPDDAQCGGVGNDCCTFDRADQSVHALWQAGVGSLPGGCGYEEHGFASIMTAVREPQGTCLFTDCVLVPPEEPFLGTDVTLVRDLGCCEGVEPVPMDLSGDCTYTAP